MLFSLRTSWADSTRPVYAIGLRQMKATAWAGTEADSARERSIQGNGVSTARSVAMNPGSSETIDTLRA